MLLKCYIYTKSGRWEVMYLCHRHLGPGFFFFFNFINKMCIYNVYEPVWYASLWNKRLGKWDIVHKGVYFTTKHFKRVHIRCRCTFYWWNWENKYPGPKCVWFVCGVSILAGSTILIFDYGIFLSVVFIFILLLE